MGRSIIRARLYRARGAILALALAGCGGGSGGGVASAPTPTPAPAPTSTPIPLPTPTPTPTPAASFDTAEYRRTSGLAFHNAVAAYQAGISGAGVTVGVVDSGLSDPTGELAGRISPASRDFAGNGSYADATGHGSAVSAVIAAARDDQRIMGVAWGATILALRTDDRGDCNADGCTHPTQALANAVDHAWQNGARVINISLGGGAAPMHLLQAVARATAAGTIVVVAAGNNPVGQAPQATPNGLARSLADPAYSRGLVIIATSVDEDDQVSGFSAGVQGFETVSLAAMGNRVLTIDHTGQEMLYTGTSFAAPQIAGAVALMAQAFPNLASRQIVELLLSSARDAGAPGADRRYGAGILDIAAAFAPRGQLGLAGSGIAVSPAVPTSLSAPMGDARPAALGAVALDSYARAYTVDLAARILRPAPSRGFASALDVGQRRVELGTQALRLALNIAPQDVRSAALDPSTRGARDEARPRFLSGTVSAALPGGGAVALGLRRSLWELERDRAAAPAPAFLMTGHGFDGQRGEARATSAVAFSQRLGSGFSLGGGFETGDMAHGTRSSGHVDPLPGRPAPYRAGAASLGLERGALGLSAGVLLLDEPASLLGARFAPTLGAQSARTLFARLGLAVQPAAGLDLSLNWQRGWTRAAGGGALRDGGRLVSESWSAQIARRDLLAPGDLAGLRIAQPLRVIDSRFALTLPALWDWETGIATDRLAILDLAPAGRQRDHELSYGRPVGGAWLGVNLFLREQAGNIAAMPDEAGVALRWSMGF